jgi:hypothetical protein
MRPVTLWSDPGLPEKDGMKSSVYSLDFSKDGELLVVACANLVLVYHVKEGDLVHRLKGHKADVYSVSCMTDATRFASGGADKTVIIWSNKGEGVLKYTHNDSIQVDCNCTRARLVSVFEIEPVKGNTYKVHMMQHLPGGELQPRHRPNRLVHGQRLRAVGQGAKERLEAQSVPAHPVSGMERRRQESRTRPRERENLDSRQ